MKAKLALWLLAGTAFLCREAAAQDQKQTAPPPAAKPADAKKDASVEVYVHLMPFTEYVNATGPNPEGFQESSDHIGTSVLQNNGVHPPKRIRMTSGSSHFGVRGSLRLSGDLLSVIGQVETSMPLDGDPNPWDLEIPNRNSYLGLTGLWGTLAVGRIDTPYKWITLTTVNPIKAGYVADYTPIIGTPGFLVTALPNVPRWVAGNGVSNTAFYRREANTIQYWTPTLAGFYARFSYSTNELRQADDEATGAVRSNPYIVSIGGGFDFRGLRLRYAWENHHDYFGLGYINQLLTGAPNEQTRTANDWGNKAVAQYTLTVNPDIKTRVVGIFEHLKYTVDATIPDNINSYERPAFYALLQQTLFGHSVWGAYGRAYPGKCERLSGGPLGTCSTAHVGAKYMMGGYMYEFTANAQAFAMVYRLINERSAVYVTSPALAREGLSPGLDQFGAALGFSWAFSGELIH
jgi:predicted porin